MSRIEIRYCRADRDVLVCVKLVGFHPGRLYLEYQGIRILKFDSMRCSKCGNSLQLLRCHWKSARGWADATCFFCCQKERVNVVDRNGIINKGPILRHQDMIAT